MTKNNLFLSAFIAVGLLVSTAQAQITSGDLLGQHRVITTAVPFLGITPDTRSGGMADVGAATDPDANSIHWNPAKLAFLTNPLSFSISYTPWLHALVPDISLSYVGFTKKIDEFSGFGASLRYFSLGDIQFTDNFGNNIKSFRPYEFAVDLAYARKLAKHLSLGIAGRYIYSNLAGHTGLGGGNETKPGIAFAGDISLYHSHEVTVGKYNGSLAFGGNISNIGNKITYTNETERDFIPVNLKLGSTLDLKISEFHAVSVSLDINKLLVPTNPIFDIDSLTGQIKVDTITGKFIVLHGRDPDQPVPAGMIQSFYDAPGTLDTAGNKISGSGLKEELHEYNPSIGVEYWYQNQFAARAGYFYEHKSKGGRQYLTLGAGVKYQVFSLDFAYLIPTTSQKSTARSPLQDTIRFSLKFDFMDKKHDTK